MLDRRIYGQHKGFTLAEMLIVVAIIGMLAAISVPIFGKQLEKSRDAASIANIRAAYSQAVYYSYEYNGCDYTGQDNTYQPEEETKIWVDKNNAVSAVRIKVEIESHEANNWSGMAENLPFTMVNSKGNTVTDSGEYSTSYRTWYLNVQFNHTKNGDVKEAELFHY